VGSRGLCLIIEDDRDIRDLLTLILTRIGLDFHAVARALRVSPQLGNTTPSSLTVDLNLPDMDGLDVAGYIRKRSEAPLLFITARAEADDEMAGMAPGAADYLTKPFRPRQLIEAVNRLCPTGPLTAITRISAPSRPAVQSPIDRVRPAAHSWQRSGKVPARRTQIVRMTC
jgi:DNA-binding response OmpR family regulator